MDVVYILWHSYEDDEHEDSKLIGVYSSQELAESAKRNVINQPGFNTYPNGFVIDKYEMNQDNWTEGFVV
jgi:homoserine kinase type II